MKKFFVPSSWEKNSDAINFQPSVKGNASNKATTAKAKKENKSKNKKNKKKAEKQPKTDTPTIATTPSVKSGRVEKKKNAKKAKKLQQKKLTPALAEAVVESLASKNVNAAPASFEDKLKEQLMGGRFRFINEQLYTMDSQKAESLFREDADAFTAYHVGYRHQVEHWPLNPLDRIVKMIRRLPKSLEIGDFGCGEGKLAKTVPHKVHSMDLVSTRDDIIACNMSKTPLAAHSLDVAVYCLSLMGTNLNDYLLEANRVLKMDGLVYIAEIQSRFDDVRQFVKGWEACGFQLVKKDVDVKLFYFFQFKKVRNVGKVALLHTFSLKPCLYRKR